MKPVKRAMLITIFLMTFCFGVFGQHGTAPNGYYPMGYAGDTWTGEVVSTDDVTREINLTLLKREEIGNIYRGSKRQLSSENERRVSKGTQTFGYSQGYPNYCVVSG
jgi:hypothetical protein